MKIGMIQNYTNYAMKPAFAAKKETPKQQENKEPITTTPSKNDASAPWRSEPYKNESGRTVVAIRKPKKDFFDPFNPVGKKEPVSKKSKPQEFQIPKDRSAEPDEVLDLILKSEAENDKI